MNRTPEETRAAVEALLAAAGLRLPEDELVDVVAAYPALRARLDALHDVPVPREEVPELVYRPVPVSSTRPPRRRRS